MLKLLYILFRKRFLQLAFNSQSKKNGFENMEMHFSDSKGLRYYRYINDFDVPIMRFKEIQKRLQLFSSGLSDKSIRQIASQMKKALNGGKKSDLADLGFWITEIEKRAELFVDTELLMDTACLLYIREDESPSKIDWAIHKEKVAQLTLDSQGGLYDFFYMTGLTQYLPFMGTTSEEFDVFYKKSEVKMKSLQKMTELVSSGAL